MKAIWVVKTANLHQLLIRDELKQLLPECEIEELNPVLFKVNANLNEINNLYRFSSITRKIINSPRFLKTVDLFQDKIDISKFKPLEDNSKVFKVENNSSIAVRYHQIGKKNEKLLSPIVEKKIATALFTINNTFKVDLVNPQFVYQAYTYGDNTVMGWVSHNISFSEVQDRAPKKSPYFGGGALKPHLSRLLVNLLQPLDPYILDPFSGHGGILREIAEMNATAIGFEISPKLSNECKVNNYHFKKQDLILLVTCDSLSPPIRRDGLQQVVTDPPYAIQTTTIGRDRDELLREWMKNQIKGLIMVFCTPTKMLNKVSQEWKVLLDKNDYVHKSLTRRVRKIIKDERSQR